VVVLKVVWTIVVVLSRRVSDVLDGGVVKDDAEIEIGRLDRVLVGAAP